MGLRIIRACSNSRPEGNDRPRPFAFARQSITQTVVRSWIIRKPNSFSEITDCFVNSSLVQDHLTEMSLGNVIVRCIGQGVVPQGLAIPPGRRLPIADDRQPYQDQTRK